MSYYYDEKPRNPLQRFGDAVSDVYHRYRRLPVVAQVGLPLTAAGGGAAAVLAFSGHEEQVTPEDLANGKLTLDKGEKPLLNKEGLPALFSYFDPAQDKALEVSFATKLPEHFKPGHPAGDYLNTVQNEARSSWDVIIPITTVSCDDKGNCTTSITYIIQTEYQHQQYPLDIQNHFQPVSREQEGQIRQYFKDFSEATGIPVHFSYDNPKAHVNYANYQHDPEDYYGSLDYVKPGEIASVPPGAEGSGRVRLQNGFLLNEARHDIRDALGAALGFESGDVNFLTLRDALAEAGWQVPVLNKGDTEYQLSHSFRSPSFLPDRVIVDNGGKNTLTGTPENDTLVTEAGYCGATRTPTNSLTNIFGNGDRYCIAEGNISVVKAGEGDDLILTSRGGSQEIRAEAGKNRIAVFHLQDGDKTVLTSDGGENTLMLHGSLFQRGGVDIVRQKDDIILNFHFSGGKTPDARIILPGQLAGKGVQNLVIVDNKGEELLNKKISGLAEEGWQQLATEIEITVEKNLDQAMAARLGRRNRTTNDGQLQQIPPGRSI